MSTKPTPAPYRNPVAARLGRLAQALIAPPAALDDVALRRKSRLLATLLLTLIALFALVDIVRLFTTPGYRPPWYGYLLFGSAYALNRTRYYRLVAALTIAAFPLIIFTFIMNSPAYGLSRTVQYLVLSVFLASIFVSWRGLAVLAAINSAGLLLLPILFPVAVPTYTSMVTPLAVNMIGAALALISMRHRDQVERDRQAELRASEEHLRLALDAARMGTWDWDVLADTITASEHVAQLFGLPVGACPDTQAAYLQLLAFSRQQVLAPRHLDLNTVVADMGQLLKRLIGEDIELVIQPAPDLGPVHADPGQLAQVLMNLAVNARDAMPAGGTLTIATANVAFYDAYVREHIGVERGSYIMVTISDTGVGMEAATRARIFEPFYTTKAVGKGTGLGLATVHGIVTQSGGHIWVYSEPGHGTTFKIYLPRVEAAGDPASAAGPLAEVPQGDATILLVEDEPLLRDLAGRALRGYGYHFWRPTTAPPRCGSPLPIRGRFTCS